MIRFCMSVVSASVLILTASSGALAQGPTIHWTSPASANKLYIAGDVIYVEVDAPVQYSQGGVTFWCNPQLFQVDLEDDNADIAGVLTGDYKSINNYTTFDFYTDQTTTAPAGAPGSSKFFSIVFSVSYKSRQPGSSPHAEISNRPIEVYTQL